jgi:hypothetical protein
MFESLNEKTSALLKATILARPRPDPPDWRRRNASSLASGFKSAEMKDTQASFAMMRQGLTQLHVANLNISENIGDKGFIWKVQTSRY